MKRLNFTQKTLTAARTRAKGRCEYVCTWKGRCAHTGRLEGHHADKAAWEHGDNSLGNLLMVCRSCHRDLDRRHMLRKFIERRKAAAKTASASPKSRWPSQKLASREFDKTVTRRMNGTVERKAQ